MADFTVCPICGSSSIRLGFKGRTNRNPEDGRVWPVFECDECGHGFINPQPDAETLTQYYSSSYDPYDEHHGGDGNDEEMIAQARSTGQFRHIPIPAGKKVLDFGCGGGLFLRICSKLGAEVQGIEPSRHGAEITRRQAIPVFEGTLDQFLDQHGDKKFDVITSNHVIEHVPDPIKALEGLGSLLAPGGMMTIAVPNAASSFARALREDWYSTDLPFHLHQFSARSLGIAAERAGLSVREIGTTSLVSSVGASMRLLLRKNYFLPQRLTARLPLDALYSRMAKRQDAERRGEALLARFAA
jgi:2-polyprenyl-3-methyl-5-hydroxy-6-metoxy-1,4-benzoquinol methylase